MKKPFKQIKGLSYGKSPIELFTHCYPNLWKDVCEYHEEMSKWNASRIKKKLSSVYEYESPEQFFESHLDGKVDTSIVNGKTQEEIKAIIDTIRNHSLAKLRLYT